MSRECKIAIWVIETTRQNARDKRRRMLLDALSIACGVAGLVAMWWMTL